MRKLALGLAVVLVLSLLLAGCVSRPTGGQTAAQASPGDVVIDLHALVLDFDSNGTASVGGIALGDLMGGDGVSLPADVMANLADANIQHVQLDMHPAGMSLRVNGLPMLGSIAYDAERLANLMSMLNELSGSPMLAMLEDLIPVLAALVPMLDNLGVGVIAHFPVPAGMEAIPLTMATDGGMDAPVDFLADVSQKPRISLPVFIEPDGSWGTSELEPAALLAMMGGDADLNLPADTVAMVASSGIATLEIRTMDEGLSLSVNSYALPLLTWSQGELQAMLALAAAGDMGGMSDMLELVHVLLPLIQATDLDITLHFPDMDEATAG